MERQTASRELVFCHVCEEEWYRNEHGLTCPNCQSDFCEVIEQNHDPRTEFYGQNEEADVDPHHVADPDEDDIGRFTTFGPMSSTFEIDGRPAGDTTTSNEGFRDPANRPAAAPTDPMSTLFGNFTTMLQGIMGGAGPNTQRTTWQSPGGQGQIRTTTYQFGNGRFTFSTSSGSTNRAGPNFDGPAFGGPDEFSQMMAAMFGPAMQGQAGPGARGSGGMPPNPFGHLYSLLNGTHGDFAHTQEGFDRIITQLMEQNQAGNAPGPAPAEEIAALPKKKVVKEMLGDNGKAECTICMDEVQLGDEVTMLYCGHWFHGDCIGAWLNSHDTCPHCRMSLRESKEKSQSASSGGSGNEGEPSRKRRPSTHSRRSSTMSFRRRSSTNASSSSSRPGPSNRDSQAENSSPGLIDRARNLFRGGS